MRDQCGCGQRLQRFVGAANHHRDAGRIRAGAETIIEVTDLDRYP
jgi:hypothetical protein